MHSATATHPLMRPAARPRTAARPTEQTVVRVKLAVLALAGMLTHFTVGLVGAFPLGELVLAGALGWAILYMILEHAVPGTLLRSRLLWVFVACQLAAFVGYVLSDLYWGSSSNDIARGWARMIFLGIDVLAIAFLFDVPAWPPELGFVFFALGYALGGGISTLMGNVIFDDYWKFGWATPITIAVLLVAPRLGYWVCQAACVGLGVLHVALDFRSMAAICLALPALLIVQRFPPRQRVALAVCGALLVSVFAVKTFTNPPSDNNFRAARSDIERRAMMQAAWQGFLRSPWLGNGSWFSKSNVMEEFYAIRLEQAKRLGIGSFGEDDGNTLVIHSQVLVGLAEGGLLGGCFFLCYGVGLVWALAVILLKHPWHVWTNLCAFFLVLKICDLISSPFSGAHRVLIAAGVGLILLVRYKIPADRRHGLALADPAAPPSPTAGFFAVHGSNPAAP